MSDTVEAAMMNREGSVPPPCGAGRPERSGAGTPGASGTC